MKRIFATVCILFACTPWVISAPVLLTFDDLPSVYGDPLPTGYGGFQWNNFNFTDGVHTAFPSSGYRSGVISPNNVIFNGWGDPAQLSIESGSFDLNSAYLTAVWQYGLQVEVQGWTGGSLTYDETYSLSTIAPTFIQFGFYGVDQVNFITQGPSAQFAMDNLSLTPVPEPSPSAGALVGLALMGLRQIRKPRP